MYVICIHVYIPTYYYKDNRYTYNPTLRYNICIVYTHSGKC